jgi:hypothetical protein
LIRIVSCIPPLVIKFVSLIDVPTLE